MVKLTRGGKIVIAIVVGLLAGAIIAVIASCGGGPTGFHDMKKLQASVAQQEQTTYGVTVSKAECVSTGANTASCNIQSVDGQSLTISVNISPDGNSWVSH